MAQRQDQATPYANFKVGRLTEGATRSKARSREHASDQSGLGIFAQLFARREERSNLLDILVAAPAEINH